MPSTLTIIRQRRSRREHLRRSAERRTQRAALGFGFVASALLAVLILAFALAYADLIRDLPPVEQLTVLLDPPNGILLQPTRLYDRTGQHLLLTLSPAGGSRGYVPYDQLPKSLIDASIALADPGFWEHPGYLMEGWRDSESHPTIAQSLVSNLLLWDEPPSVRRAIRERLLAAQITAQYGREKVMEWYLNSANFGHYAYGVESAAQLYFGKSAADLDVSESALLAAVGQAPALNPLDALQAAESERLKTLQIMLAMGMIEEIPAPLSPLPPYPSGMGGEDGVRGMSAFTSLVLSQLGEQFDRLRIERGGLVILTTLDYDLQLQVACALQTQLARAGGDMTGITAADGSPCAAANLLPTLPPEMNLPGATASALILDPRTGQVLAAVGDTTGAQESPYLVSHPAGTLITPFIYLTGFTRGLSPASLGWDIPGAVTNPGGLYRGPVRLRIAMANDCLPPAVTVLEQMGETNVRRVAALFGLDLPPDSRLLVDDPAISPLTIASAYGIFADQGTLAGQSLRLGSGQAPGGESLVPAAVLKVTGVDNAIWADWRMPAAQAVVSPQLAYLMNHVLSDETARWPSLGHPNAFEIGRPAGAKLGLPLPMVQDDRLDGGGVWAAGYTPQRVTVVWVSGAGEAAVEVSGSGAARLATGLWHALMQYSLRDLPVESWAVPAGIVQKQVCDPSGMLPSAACPNVVGEVFMTGNEPVQVDTLYQVFEVNRETGLLATIFTPPELVEERVFMVVPAEARQWAEAAGIEPPPTIYDTIQILPALPDAHITAPAMFADVRGVVTISGSAAGADFAYYRLEYGQGLNPRTWVQIGADVTAPTTEDVLTEWDTSGLDGLFALRLLVVRTDQSVEQAVTQVTVDNTPPQVTVLSPQDGETFDLAEDRQIALQAQVSDMYLAKVKFYIDGELVGEMIASPFSLGWQTSKGTHTLRIVATDRAGNTTETSVTFSVVR